MPVYTYVSDDGERRRFIRTDPPPRVIKAQRSRKGSYFDEDDPSDPGIDVVTYRLVESGPLVRELP